MANYRALVSDLRQSLGYDQVVTDEMLCRVLGRDASLYELTPKCIIKARNADEVSQILTAAANYNTPVTFRAAGTSLSGQGVTDSVLLMLDDGWQNTTVLDDGEKLRCQPGVIGAHANQRLAQYQRKIGPDPASIDSCMVGGIAANNASGMCCGTEQNSYQTLAAMSFILADGTQVRSDDLVSVENFRQSHAELLDKLATMAHACQNDAELVALIKHKYRLKNTTGFSLNALLDFDDPIEILTHLMIGSEGCLGFISDITYHTVPDYVAKATGLFVFNSLEAACQWVVDYGDNDIHAVELLDDRALESVSDKLKGLVTYRRGNAALLIECQAENEALLKERISTLQGYLADQDLADQYDFTTAADIRSRLWRVRKGVVPSVAGQRRPNTSVIIEDIAFPRKHLSEAIVALRETFIKHHYLDISIIGHAREGNLHFIMAHDFSEPDEIKQYQAVMADLGELVIRLDGSLKAEHGTGRNMAPYVELEWGSQAYQLMHDIKTLLDPQGLLNPGVVLNEDKSIHVKNLKQLPITHPIVDQCMECGYCETACPSTALSLSPRQRIVLAREIERLNAGTNTPEHQHQLQHARQLFDELAIKTCATTSMCQQACPVGIDTGNFIIEKMASRPGLGNKIISALAPIHGMGLWLSKGLLWLAYHLQQRGLTLATTLPRPAKKPELINNASPAKAVWFSTCQPRVMSSTSDPEATEPEHLAEALSSLMNKADIEMIPLQSSNSCCGLAYHSRGLNAAAEDSALKLIERLEAVSQGGKYPIVFDAGSCLLQLVPYLPKHLKCYEACDYVRHFILPEIEIRQQTKSLLLHLNCSTKRLGLADSLTELAKACSSEVHIPEGIECCGFAGTKGFSNPELNQHALRGIRAQIPDHCSRGFSNSLGCEFGLTQHTEIPYQSLLFLVDELSSSAKNSKSSNKTVESA